VYSSSVTPRPPSASPRRLPVLQNSVEEDDARPRWHWVPIGAAFALSIWLPLAMVTTWLGRWVIGRVLPASALPAAVEELARARAWESGLLGFALFALPLLGFAVAALCAGLLVGRFGARVEARDAAWSGALAALFAALLTASSGGLLDAAAGLAILLPDGALAGYLGGRWGKRLQRRSITRAPPGARP